MCANPLAARASLRRIAELLETHADSTLKRKASDFTRGGPLRPHLLITLLLYLVADGGRRGYRHLLEGFWEDAREQGLALPTEEPVSAPGFCKARRKLRPEALRAMLHDVADAFDREHGAQHRVRGRRVLAVDASKIALQRSGALFDAFGAPECGFTPQVMVSALIDVVARLPVDATVAPFASCERAQLTQLVGRMRRGDVLLLDRGFPSYEVIELLLARGIDFVMRVATAGSFPAVHDFLQSGGDDYRVLLAPGKNIDAQLRGPFELRAVRREGPDGEPQVFLTTLRRSEFSRAQVLDLYRRRWEIELFFRLEKGDYLGHDQFHARTPDGVRQEVFALLLFVALTRTIMSAAARVHGVPAETISQKGAILAVARTFTRLLLQQDERRAHELLQRLLSRLARMLEKKRPRRSFPRLSFKPRPRWGPKGNGR